jgi:hypothetical protein
MCRLVALETADAARGINPARPFAIQPPLGTRAEDDRYYRLGESFQFGINLFGDASDLFPYIIQAVHRMGRIGIGYGRGTFSLTNVHAVNALSGTRQELLEGGRVISSPSLPLTAQQVNQVASGLSHNRLRLRFLTPTQLTSNGSQFCGTPQFDVLIGRLVERCQSIEQYYTEQPTPQEQWRDCYLNLTQRAKQVKLIENGTRWVRARSGSRRSNVSTPLGGLVGTAIYEGDLQPFLAWALWGQSLHVGKNAVKGCGWYELVAS